MWFDSYNYVISKYDSSVYPNDINLIRRGILIDTAPLFILVVGHYDEINNTHYVEWKIVDNPEHFKENSIVCADCLLEKDFLDKKIEIGDISITIITNSTSNPYCCILTDDKPFAILADRKYNQVVIYYDDIRNATYALNPKQIPIELLVDLSDKA